MKVSVKSDVGLVRETNQDSYCHHVFGGNPESGSKTHLCAVADGIGGYQAGDVASRLALEAVAEVIGAAAREAQPLDRALAQAMTAANQRIVRQGLEDPACRGMGTTVTAAVIDGLELHLGHVGDSRAYLFRDGRLVQLTDDHSLVAELVRNGDITEEEAAVHPQRNVVTRAFGADLRVKADVSTRNLDKGDILLLCTDGLTGPVSGKEIETVLSEAASLDEACDRLVALSNERGGYDNVTVLLAGPVNGEGEGQ